MRIGLDFDNTIVAYDEIFLAMARQWGLIPEHFSGAKTQLRDWLRAATDGELQWQRLQGHVYGKQMENAKLFPGVAGFFQQCKHNGVTVYIVSHKTEYAHHDPDNTNLRQAAWGWMEKNAFFKPDGFNIDKDNVFFNDTRDAKLRKIRQLRCDVFIDDLAEVFTDSGFPRQVQAILFDPQKSGKNNGQYNVFGHWNEINDALFGKLN